MILKKLVLNNFRQYLGRQEIVFAAGKQRNVTLIHGENGFGKTCLLNALLWGFYGEDGFTADLPTSADGRRRVLPDSIRAASTRAEDEVASIEIVFQHGEREFTLTRSTTLAKENESRGNHSELTLSILQPDGCTLNDDGRDAQKVIQSILPADLREWIFFNGERIDHLAMEENSSKVRDAVRGLLGLDLLERAIEDLEGQSVRGRLTRELQANADEETQKLIGQENTTGAEMDSRREELQICKSNQRSVAEEMAAIDAKLAANREAHELQQRRALLEEQRSQGEESLKAVERQLRDLIATDGYTLFCLDLVGRGKSIADALRAEGRIPARVMNDFIYDLLRSGICICGKPLPEGSEERHRVEQQLTEAGDPEFNRAVGDLDKAIGVIEVSIGRTRTTVVQLVGQRDQITAQLSAIREELADIRDRIGGKEDEQVQRLESRREELELRRDELLREEGRLKREIEALHDELATLAQRIQAKQQQAEAGRKAQRRLQRVDEAVALLEQILQVESDDLRAELGREIERIFGMITLHDYRLELTDEFTLRLSKLVPGTGGVIKMDVAHSTGQRQVMSLVFISSLVALAQRRNQIPTILKDLQGGDYPMVMDSPFGQLAEDFRTAIARVVPALAPQTVVFVSSSQYKGEVERELGTSSRVGRRYLLRYHAPSKRQEARETIEIGGQSHTIFMRDKTEHTEIVEVQE